MDQNITNLEHLSRLIILFNQENPDAFIKSSQCALEANNNFQSSNPLDFWLNPSEENKANFEDYKTAVKTQIQTMDTVKSFKSLMSALWYSRLPCFDIKGKFLLRIVHEWRHVLKMRGSRRFRDDNS
jgi:hypothetical protein